MSDCLFCGVKENQVTPVCQSCGALRYPVNNNRSAAISRQDKLKLSATVAVAVFTPGAFIVLALMGASKLIPK